MESYSESYKKAGVDVTAGYKAVELMKSHIARTMTANVLTDIGGFGGLYALDVAGRRSGYRLSIIPLDETGNTWTETDINIVYRSTEIIIAWEVSNHYE